MNDQKQPYEVIFDPGSGLQTSIPDGATQERPYGGLRIRAQGQQKYEHMMPKPKPKKKAPKKPGKGKKKRAPARRAK